MRSRDVDYGFRPGEINYLKSIARENDYAKRLTLHAAAYEANKYVSEDIVYSIVNGLSYETITRAHYIPINKNDFYAYCRKCLAIFRDELENEAAI